MWCTPSGDQAEKHQDATYNGKSSSAEPNTRFQPLCSSPNVSRVYSFILSLFYDTLTATVEQITERKEEKAAGVQEHDQRQVRDCSYTMQGSLCDCLMLACLV